MIRVCPRCRLTAHADYRGESCYFCGGDLPAPETPRDPGTDVCEDPVGYCSDEGEYGYPMFGQVHED